MKLGNSLVDPPNRPHVQQPITRITEKISGYLQDSRKREDCEEQEVADGWHEDELPQPSNCTAKGRPDRCQARRLAQRSSRMVGSRSGSKGRSDFLGTRT